MSQSANTAPARLGLSATPPDDEVRRSRLDMLVGPEVYRASVEELAGRYLAPFELITVSVCLTSSERRSYDAEMSVFRPVCRAFFESAPGASWSDFVASAGCSGLPQGKKPSSMTLLPGTRSRCVERTSTGGCLLPTNRIQARIDGDNATPVWLGTEDHMWLRALIADFTRLDGKRYRDVVSFLKEPARVRLPLSSPPPAGI